MKRILILCGSVLVITGCGQKGALYLPDKNASVVMRPAGRSNTTVPPGPASPQQPPENNPPQTAPAPTTTPKSPQDQSKDQSQSSSSSTPPQ